METAHWLGKKWGETLVGTYEGTGCGTQTMEKGDESFQQIYIGEYTDIYLCAQ